MQQHEGSDKGTGNSGVDRKACRLAVPCFTLSMPLVS